MSRLTVPEWGSGGLVWRATLNKALVLIPGSYSQPGSWRSARLTWPGVGRKCATCPKWVWAILCMGTVLTIPFGWIAYLVFGEVRLRTRDNDQGVMSPRCVTQTSPIRRGPG